MTTYDYLGLLGHSFVNDQAKRAIDEFGTGGHCTAAAAGMTSLHRALEERLATRSGHEDALLFPSGYQANQSTLPALSGRGDWIFSDRLNHASIVDGCLAAQSHGAQLHVFDHNDANHLRKLLRSAPAATMKLVVCDAVFSADGDLLDLPSIDAACRDNGAYLYLDEAHSFGLFGPDGQGLHSHFGMRDKSRTLTMASLSKTFSSVGGFVAADKELVDALRLTARGYVFSGVVPPPAVAAALAALDLLDSEGEQRRAVFRDNIRYVRRRMREESLPIPEACDSGIVPVIVDEERRALDAAECCRQNGVMVVPFVWPVCARGQARLRVNVTARHSFQDIDRVVSTLATALRSSSRMP